VASALYLVPRRQQVGVIEPVSPFQGQGVLNPYISASLVTPIVIGMFGGSIAFALGASWPVIGASAMGAFSFAYLLGIGRDAYYAKS